MRLAAMAAQEAVSRGENGALWVGRVFIYHVLYSQAVAWPHHQHFTQLARHPHHTSGSAGEGFVSQPHGDDARDQLCDSAPRFLLLITHRNFVL